METCVFKYDRPLFKVPRSRLQYSLKCHFTLAYSLSGTFTLALGHLQTVHEVLKNVPELMKSDVFRKDFMKYETFYSVTNNSLLTVRQEIW